MVWKGVLWGVQIFLFYNGNLFVEGWGRGGVVVHVCSANVVTFIFFSAKPSTGKGFEGGDWGLVVKGGKNHFYILLWCRRGYYDGIIL